MTATIRATIKEAFRRQTLVVSVVLVTLLMAALWYFVAHQQKAAIANAPMVNTFQSVTALGLGSFMINLVVAFFAIFCLSGNLSSEIETGTLAAVAARPIVRSRILLGKWIGIALIEIGYVSLVFAGVIGIILTYNPWVTPAGQLLAAWGLFVLEGWLLSAVALLLSVWLSPVAGGVGLSILYFTEFVAGAFSQSVGSQASSVHAATSVLALLLPTDSLYRRATFEIFGGRHNPLVAVLGNLGPLGVNFTPSWGTVVYALIYLTGILALVVKIFKRRDI